MTGSVKGVCVMSTEVTLILPDAVYQRAERLAQLSRRDVAEVLTEMITCPGSYSEGGSGVAVRALSWQRHGPRSVDRSPPPWAG